MKLSRMFRAWVHTENDKVVCDSFLISLLKDIYNLVLEVVTIASCVILVYGAAIISYIDRYSDSDTGRSTSVTFNVFVSLCITVSVLMLITVSLAIAMSHSLSNVVNFITISKPIKAVVKYAETCNMLLSKMILTVLFQLVYCCVYTYITVVSVPSDWSIAIFILSWFPIYIMTITYINGLKHYYIKDDSYLICHPIIDENADHVINFCGTQIKYKESCECCLAIKLNAVVVVNRYTRDLVAYVYDAKKHIVNKIV